MKTVKFLAVVAILGLLSFSNYAQTPNDNNHKIIFANYENHRNPEFRSFKKSSDPAEEEFLGNSFESKMAELNIERINYNIEKSIKYIAPSVEVIEAKECLDSIMVQIEKEIKYIAPKN
jgi:hypothetical protein